MLIYLSQPSALLIAALFEILVLTMQTHKRSTLASLIALSTPPAVDALSPLEP